MVNTSLEALFCQLTCFFNTHPYSVRNLHESRVFQQRREHFFL